jgi:hypothetical protein
MKELVFKKMTEMEEIYKNAHMDIDSDSERRVLSDLIDSGLFLPFFHNEILLLILMCYLVPKMCLDVFIFLYPLTRSANFMSLS